MIGFTRGWTVAMGAAALLAGACQRQEDSSRRQARSADQTGQSRPLAGSQRPETAAPATGAQTGAQAGAEKTASGQVVSAKADELVLKQESGGPDLKLKVSPSTTVTMGGRQASVSELKEGTQVRAAYQEQGGDQQAIRIEALTGASGSGPSSVGKPPADSTPPSAAPGSTPGAPSGGERR